MIYCFAVIFSVIFVIFILNLVKKDKLDEKYSILWIITGGITLIVSLFPKIITIIANKFNVYYPPSLMFLFAILVLVIYVIHITIVITKQNKMIVKLTQELGILKEEVKKDNSK